MQELAQCMCPTDRSALIRVISLSLSAVNPSKCSKLYRSEFTLLMASAASRNTDCVSFLHGRWKEALRTIGYSGDGFNLRSREIDALT